MGLDNGIILKTKKEINLNVEDGDFDAVPSCVHIEELEKSEDGFYQYDVCYWRKCWGLRNTIVEILEMDEHLYEKDVNLKNLSLISDAIYYILKEPDCWESSVWDIDEMTSHLAQDIININWLIKYLKNNNHAYCYFYDSY